MQFLSCTSTLSRTAGERTGYIVSYIGRMTDAIEETCANGGEDTEHNELSRVTTGHFHVMSEFLSDSEWSSP